MKMKILEQTKLVRLALKKAGFNYGAAWTDKRANDGRRIKFISHHPRFSLAQEQDITLAVRSALWAKQIVPKSCGFVHETVRGGGAIWGTSANRFVCTLV